MASWEILFRKRAKKIYYMLSHSPVTVENLEVITYTMVEKLTYHDKLLDKFDIYNTARFIIELLMGQVIPENGIHLREKIWDMTFQLTQLVYKYRTTLNSWDIVNMYKLYLELPVTATFDEDGNPIGVKRPNSYYSFSSTVNQKLPEFLRWKSMWDLWYENDPAVHNEGVGNLTVWLPRETLEDVMSFKPLTKANIYCLKDIHDTSNCSKCQQTRYQSNYRC